MAILGCRSLMLVVNDKVLRKIKIAVKSDHVAIQNFVIIMDKKPNEIHENLIPMKINYHIIQFKTHIYTATNTNIPYN